MTPVMRTERGADAAATGTLRRTSHDRSSQSLRAVSLSQ